MRSRRSGTIINIGSSTAVNPTPGLGLYSATKYAVEGQYLHSLFLPVAELYRNVFD